MDIFMLYVVGLMLRLLPDDIEPIGHSYAVLAVAMEPWRHGSRSDYPLISWYEY